MNNVEVINASLSVSSTEIDYSTHIQSYVPYLSLNILEQVQNTSEREYPSEWPYLPAKLSIPSTVNNVVRHRKYNIYMY